MSEQWQPFSARLKGKRPTESLHKGVPAHLAPALQDWLEAILSYELAQRICLRLRIDVESNSPVHALIHASGSILLDAIDASISIDPSVEIINPRANPKFFMFWLDRLDELLKDGGSAYEVNLDEKCLVARVEPAVQEVADRATSQARPDAGRHLRNAWLSAYGLHPEPTKAYSEAVKAVESAAIPIVLPRGNRETLGKVIKHLQDAPEKWEISISDKNGNGEVAPLVAMIRLLWEGQSDRHGGGPRPRPISQESAEMALHLAATIVHWFSAGLVKRRA